MFNKKTDSGKFEPTKPVFNVKMSSEFKSFVRLIITCNPDKNPLALTQAIEDAYVANNGNEAETIQQFSTEEYNMKPMNETAEDAGTNQFTAKKSINWKQVGRTALKIGIPAVAGFASGVILDRFVFNKHTAAKKTTASAPKASGSKKPAARHAPAKKPVHPVVLKPVVKPASTGLTK